MYIFVKIIAITDFYSSFNVLAQTLDSEIILDGVKADLWHYKGAETKEATVGAYFYCQTL